MHVTVVIPVYNGERLLPVTLASLAAQTFADAEFLLVDDCSTDGSVALLEAFARDEPRARVMRLPVNHGNVPRVLNAVLPLVESAFFAYSSHDDFYAADWLERCHARAVETDADAVLPDTEFYDPAARTPRRLDGFRGRHDIVLSGRDAVAASLHWSISGFAMWRTRLVQEIGFADFCSSADEFSTRQMFLACRAVAFADTTFFYRQDNPDAVTKKLSFRPFEQPITNLAVFRLLVTNGFDARLCRQELVRAVASLLYCRRLMMGSGWRLGRAERRRAAEALQRSAAALRADDVAAFVREQRRLFAPKDRLKLRLAGM